MVPIRHGLRARALRPPRRAPPRPSWRRDGEGPGTIPGVAEADRERWDRRYAERGAEAREPAAFLLEIAEELPTRGRALDLAGGAGHNALWLAQRGLAVVLCDVSRVALELAAGEAAARGITLVTDCRDLEVDPPPAGPWDLILVCDYLQRDLFKRFPDLLAPGGVLVYVQPTRRNLERHAHPGARFLLGEGELRELAEGLEIVRFDEGWTRAGRHEARLLARKPRRRAAIAAHLLRALVRRSRSG